MRKINLSLVLILGTLLQAEDATTLQKVSIATKTEKNIDGVAATVEVITEAEIKKMGAVSLGDIITRAEGLNVMFGTFPSAASKSKSSITIRGMSPNGTLILLDGRRLAGEVQNPYDLDRIPATMVERVEIVKGPMSSLYGADAVGGVVNIITKRPTDGLKIDAGARYGANKHGDAEATHLNLSLQNRVDALSYSAYATLNTTKPYRINESEKVWVPTPMGKVPPSMHPNPQVNGVANQYEQGTTYREDSEIYTLGTRVAYDVSSDLTLGLDLNYFHEELEGSYIGYFHPSNIVANGNRVPFFNVPVESKDTNRRLDASVDVTYKASEDLELKARVYRSDYRKRNDTMAREYAAMGYGSMNESAQNGMSADVTLDVVEASVLYMPTDDHAVSVGAEYRKEKRESNNWTLTDEMTTRDVEYKSLYAQDEWQITDEFSTILGARYDNISTSDNKATFRVGGVYEYSKLLNLRANFAQGFRTPDLRELYIHKQTPTGMQVGADVYGYDLSPESTNAFEVGVGGRDGNFRYDVAFFYNRVKDMISQTLAPYNGGNAFTFQNVSKAYTAGMDLSLGYEISDDLVAKLYWSELKTEDKSTKEELYFQPKRVVQVGLDYDLLKDLSVGAFAKHIGKQYYEEIADRGANNESRRVGHVGAYTLLDLRADYNINKTFNIYAGIDNLMDRSIKDVLGANVGRYYFAGVRASF